MRIRIATLAVGLLAIAAFPVLAQAADWPTYHQDNTRAGYDASQPGFAGVTAGWTSGALTGTVYASPVVVGTHVFVATEGNHVYAFDTASATPSTPLWNTFVGTTVTAGFGCGGLSGITSTPVADAAANRLYVAGMVSVSNAANFYLTTLNLATGAIVAQTKLAPAGLNWVYNGQRGALTLANGYVYVPFGGRNGDCGTYHGWILGINTSTQAVTSFETDTAVNGTPFWATGGLAVDPSTSDILGATGNSFCTFPGGTPHQTQSVLRLSPTLSLLDTFTEPDWHNNSCNDSDLGSVAPLVLGGGYGFIVGKQSIGYIIRLNSLGGVGGQAFPPNANLALGDVCNGALAFGATAYAAPYILVPCDNGLVALKYDPTVPSFSVAWRGPNFWATPPIVAGGAVWTLDTSGSGLYAFDLATGAVRYQSGAISVNHFASPSESANTIFVPGSNQLLTFSMTPCPVAPAYTGYFNWYDNVSSGMYQDNIHVVNPGATTAVGCLTLANGGAVGFVLAPGQEGHYHFGPGSIGGPVTVEASARVIPSQRVTYYQTFNEVAASTAADAAMTSYFNWYDKASSGMYQDNIHLLNPSASTSNGVITLPGAANLAFSVPAGQEKYYSFPQGTIGGPVTVSVTSGPAVIASQRVTYYGSFNEVRARPASSAAMTSYFNWYDKQSTGMYQDNVHLLNPGATTASGTIAISGGPSQGFSVGAGQENHYSFPQGTIGGPITVTVTSGPGVLASQRVSYYQSFNEAGGTLASDAGATLYFAWYDKQSTGMYQDNVHILNPGATAASGTITLPGGLNRAFAVNAGQEAYYSFAQGTIGGPVTVTVTAGPPVIAAQRVTFYQSFNEVAASP